MISRGTAAKISLVALLIFSLSTTFAFAQTGMGKIQGTVKDASLAVVPGAKVTATHLPTAGQRSTTANEVGFYVFPAVQSGPYSVTVEAAGFETFKGEFLLQTGQTAVVDATLKVGSAATQITVSESAAPLVTTTAPTLAGITDRARIEQLPISGRMFQTHVMNTTPGIDGESYVPRVWGIRWGVEFLQDGSVLANRETGEIAGRPPGMDTIEEFRVETSNSSARMNRPGTVIVNTRAGTNRLHGSLLEVARNNELGFGVARRREDKWSRPPHLVRNEFGGSLGGPVYIPKVYNGRNKTFFFHSYEAFRSRTASTKRARVPTMAMRQGDFSGLVDSRGRKYTLYDPWTTDANWNRTPFPNNQIPLSRESPLAKYLFSVTPAPTEPLVNPLVSYNYYYQAPNNRMEWTDTTRIDHRLSERDQLFFRFTHGVRDSFAQSGNYNSPITLDKSANANFRPIRDNTGVASWTHTFSPRLFSETLFTAGVEDLNFANIGDTKKWADTLGLPNPFNEYGFPNLTSVGSSMMEYVSPANRRNSITHVYNLDENLTLVHGRHEFQFGGRLRYEKLNILPDQQQPMGAHSFDSLATALYDSRSGSRYTAVSNTGHNVANMFIGVIGSYSARFVRKWYDMHAREHAAYFQDNFKLSSRLTLNLGLRWEFATPIREANNILTGFDPKAKALVNGADFETMYRAKSSLPSIVQAYKNLGVTFETPKQAGLPNDLLYLNKWDFNPRAGFAYKVTGATRPLVVRGGYSIFGYQMPLRAFDARMRQNPPTTARFTYQLFNSAQTPDGLPNWGLRSAPQYIAGTNSRDVNLTTPTGISRGSFLVSYFDPHQPTSRAHEWNMTFEKEVIANTLVRTGYVGTRGSRLDMYSSYNQTPNAYVWFTTTGLPWPSGTYAGTVQRPFENTTYGDIEEYKKIGWSNAQSFQFEIQRRYARGWGFQFFYVLGNNLRAGGNGWEDPSLPSSNVFLPGAVPDNLNKRARFLLYQRDIDIPKHRYNWNWIADLPFGKGKQILGNAGPVLNRVVGGWQIAGQGSITSTWWSLPTDNWAFPSKLEFYGTKYKIQDCRSGVCQAGYLYYNGYIPANMINSVDSNGNPNGVMGVPANYKPAHSPLIPIPKNGGSPSDPLYDYYDSNTVWVRLKDGTLQPTSLDTNLHPWRNQYFSGMYNWYQNASLFKVVPVNERVFFRLNIDFFNVFNMPGIAKTPDSYSGIIDGTVSGNGSRSLQFGLRLTW